MPKPFGTVLKDTAVRNRRERLVINTLAKGYISVPVRIRPTRERLGSPQKANNSFAFFGNRLGMVSRPSDRLHCALQQGIRG